jgi:hypothetical protein
MVTSFPWQTKQKIITVTYLLLPAPSKNWNGSFIPVILPKNWNGYLVLVTFLLKNM